MPFVTPTGRSLGLAAVTRSGQLLLALAPILLLAAPRAWADYASDSSLRPENRCANLPLRENDPDCQPLIWDIPPGFPGDRATDQPLHQYANGRIDRPPPLYRKGDEGFEQPGTGRTRVCPAFEVPVWEPTGRVSGSPPDVTSEFEVVCRRGSRMTTRVHRFGTGSTAYDLVFDSTLRIENAARLAEDVQRGRTSASDPREWLTGIEIYNHHGSHHANYWEEVDYGERIGRGQHWRAATQYAGRFEVRLPEGRALPLPREPLWPGDHHITSRLTLGATDRNFNLQNGGAVGELVLQVLTEPESTPMGEVSVLFDAVQSLATLYVPPFTMGVNGGVWPVPHDVELAFLTTHSHKRTVRTWVDVKPANPVRPNSPDRACGGSGIGPLPPTRFDAPPEHVYESFHWDEARTCRYWQEPDGPIVLRKGQSLHFGCLFNNGVQPTKVLAEPVRSAVENSPAARELYGEQPVNAYRVKYACEVETPNRAGLPDYTGPVVGPDWIPPSRPLDFPARPCEPPADGQDTPYENHIRCPPGQRPFIGHPFTGRCVPDALVFADVAEDEMCILVGFYWPLGRPVDVDADVNSETVLNEGPTPDAVEVGSQPVRIDPDEVPEDPTKTGTPGTLPKSPSDLGECVDCSRALPRNPLAVTSAIP